jgi:endoglucanase
MVLSEFIPNIGNAAATRGVFVHEITVATPDMICVEVRDPPIAKGPLVELPSPDSGSYESWLSRRNPVTGDNDYCFVVGPEKRHFRFQDVRSVSYLDRDAADSPADYGRVGDREVISVYRKSIPYSSGECRGALGVKTTKAVSMKHFLFLKLSGNLAQREGYTIKFPGKTGLPETPFTFDDKLTRAIAIRSTQVGHRPGDACKLAYLALWIPGAPNEGAVEFSHIYGLHSFEIIDASGNTVFKTAIAKRVDPSTPEALAGDASRLVYGSTNKPQIAITGVSRTNPVIVTAASHRLSNGETIMIYNMDGELPSNQRGMTELNNLTYQVANATEDTFELAGIDGRTFKPYNGGGGTIYRTFTANRAGTFVYGLDYSSWVPKYPGTYRIRVPGLGVSDPFTVDENVWYQVAWNSAKGEYHQRSGCPLDGRFGYSRPSAFRGGKDLRIFLSRLPYAFSEVGIGVSRAISLENGARPPWITDSTVNVWGSWYDAGDWLTRISETASTSYILLDLHEYLSAAKETKFNIPQSSKVLDQAMYSPIDSMADVIHQAVWNLDCYRRIQAEDGSVPGGIGMSTGTGTHTFEPSWLFRGTAYAFAADHDSVFAYAGAAAKLAKVLSDSGFRTLASAWHDSAVSAWQWANNIYSDGNARDSYYATARLIAEWDDATYNANMMALQRSSLNSRLFAAGCLFRLTGESLYGDVIRKAWPFDVLNLAGSGAWEYSNAARASGEIKLAVRKAIVERADEHIVRYSEGNISYRNCQYGGLNPIFGLGGMDLDDVGPNLVRAHLLRRDRKYLIALQAGLNHIHGANQYGLCFTSGIGVRNTLGTLHADAQYGIAAGQIPDGITNYAWSLPIGGFVYTLNFAPGPLNSIVENPDPQFEPDFELQRQMSHFRRCFPLYEAIYETPHIISQMEFTVQQTIIPQEYVALYLHGWDRNLARSPI